VDVINAPTWISENILIVTRSKIYLELGWTLISVIEVRTNDVPIFNTLCVVHIELVQRLLYGLDILRVVRRA
jgi:hypothetical protein